jgi:Flp pilus assembly protein TadD
LVIATFVAYFPALRAGFIWDDDDHLTANPVMTAPHGLQMIWSSLAVSRYYPLTLTTFWIQRQLWGLNPLPYHLVNLALHAINGVLVFLVLRRLRIPAAWLAATLWVLHPVNVESVAWITELKNTQSGLFFFLSALCFLRFDEQKDQRWYTLALVCGVAAMLSKPSTVVLPAALLLCVWWKRGYWRRTDLLRIAPLLGLALGMSALTVVEQRGHILRSGATEWKQGAVERFIIAGKAVWFYAAKLLWPVPLTFVYPRWEIDPVSLANWVPLAGLVAAGVFLWRRRRETWARASLFGCAYFVAALLPVMGFFNIFYFRFSFVADHFQYLASVGLIALVVAASATICQRAGQPGRDLGMLAGAIMLLTLGVSTWRQTHIYRDPETLWRDTLTKNPQCWMAYNNLGMVLEPVGKFQDAIGCYEQSLRINPANAEAQNNLGIALFDQGRIPEAIKHYQQALEIRPAYAEAQNNWGNALARIGRIQDAIAHYQQALQIWPGYATAHNNLGNALVQGGRTQDAIKHYEQALRIKPDYAKAQNSLAWILATDRDDRVRNPAKAVQLAERTCELTGRRESNLLDTLAAAYAANGRFADAIRTAEQAANLTLAAGQKDLAGQIQNRLELYKAGRPYYEKPVAREPAK